MHSIFIMQAALLKFTSQTPIQFTDIARIIYLNKFEHRHYTVFNNIFTTEQYVVICARPPIKKYARY